MDVKRIFPALAGAVGVALAALAFAPSAYARSDVYWSVGVGGPGVSVGVTNGYPVYSQPRPVYVQPAPVYVQPRPVYVRPRPVYVQPRPIYVQPEPVYYGPPVVVGPPAYPIGWRGRGHWRHQHHERHQRHEHRDGPGWRR